MKRERNVLTADGYYQIELREYEDRPASVGVSAPCLMVEATPLVAERIANGLLEMAGRARRLNRRNKKGSHT